MNNTLYYYGSSWKKYSNQDTGLYGIITPEVDSVTVVDSISDCVIRKVNGKLTAIPMLNTSTMELGAHTYKVWRQQYTNITTPTFEDYYVVPNTAGTYNLVDELYWYWNELNQYYELLGFGDETVGSGEALRGNIVQIHNDTLWPPTGTTTTWHYAYITEDTSFFTSGEKLLVNNFELLTSLTDTGNTAELYDAANCWNENATHPTKYICIGNPVDVDKLYSYSYNTSISGYFNSKTCVGKYVFVQKGNNNGYPFENMVIKFTSNYVADNTSLSWDFLSNNPYKAYKLGPAYPETVTSSDPYAYPSDGPQGLYYYVLNYDPISGSATSIGSLDDSAIVGGVNYSLNFNSDSDIQVGLCASASIQFKTYNTNIKKNTILTYKVAFQELGQKQVGVFIVTDITKSGDLYTITAYDYISKFAKKIAISDLSTSRQYLEDLFTEICGLIGVTGLIGDSCNPSAYINYSFISGTEEIEARVILGYLAALSGCTAIADSEGNITFKKYATSSSFTMDNHKYVTFDYALYDTPLIDRLHIAESEDAEGYDAGTGNNPLYITANKAFNSTKISGGEDIEELLEITDNIYTCVSAIPVYTPGAISTYRDFDINVGDVITVDGKTFIVMDKSWSASGVTFSCAGNEYRNFVKLKKITEVSLKLDEVAGKIDNLVDGDGSISYDRLSGGTLNIGGPNNEYGAIYAYDNSDNSIGSWDNTGIKANDITIYNSPISGLTLTYYLEHLTARFG